MYAWLVKRELRRNVEQLCAGSSGALLHACADNVHFRISGDHSWTADLHGKREVSEWLDRFVRVGIQLHPEETLIKGPPWKTTFCLRFTDDLEDDNGNTVYSNRGVIYGRLRWGKILDYEVYEDTQAVTGLDEYLNTLEPASGSADRR